MKSFCDQVGHIWRIKNERGHDNVHCIRCYQCLPVDRMLQAFIKGTKDTIQ